MSASDIPLSLYVHIPWCVKKCPYCDFNSVAASLIPEAEYVTALLADLMAAQSLVAGRTIGSIFFGGGTPSLFTPKAIATVLNTAAKIFNFAANIEITLEANPGTVDTKHISGYAAIGVNRISLGAQSFNNAKLHALGRIHDSDAIYKAVAAIKSAGITNFNIDIMYGLPEQNLAAALDDLHAAISLEPSHISWYELTMELNTLFYRQKPILPQDEVKYAMQLAGQNILADNNYIQYEISAYSKGIAKQCWHNLNYWQFGDYLGIGAGAHSKITNCHGKIYRATRYSSPKKYMSEPIAKISPLLNAKTIAFEFMLNATRLISGFKTEMFTVRTGLPMSFIADRIKEAESKGLLSFENNKVTPTNFGLQFLNDLQSLFLVSE